MRIDRFLVRLALDLFERPGKFFNIVSQLVAENVYDFFAIVSCYAVCYTSPNLTNRSIATCQTYRALTA